jgi:hypothetical protein
MGDISNAVTILVPDLPSNDGVIPGDNIMIGQGFVIAADSKSLVFQYVESQFGVSFGTLNSDAATRTFHITFSCVI